MIFDKQASQATELSKMNNQDTDSIEEIPGHKLLRRNMRRILEQEDAEIDSEFGGYIVTDDAELHTSDKFASRRASGHRHGVDEQVVEQMVEQMAEQMDKLNHHLEHRTDELNKSRKIHEQLTDLMRRMKMDYDMDRIMRQSYEQQVLALQKQRTQFILTMRNMDENFWPYYRSVSDVAKYVRETTVCGNGRSVIADNIMTEYDRHVNAMKTLLTQAMKTGKDTFASEDSALQMTIETNTPKIHDSIVRAEQKMYQLFSKSQIRTSSSVSAAFATGDMDDERKEIQAAEYEQESDQIGREAADRLKRKKVADQLDRERAAARMESVKKLEADRELAEREAAERELAERELAEREAAERELAEREAAEREAAEREAAEREAAAEREREKIADQKLADERIELADKRIELEKNRARREAANRPER